MGPPWPIAPYFFLKLVGGTYSMMGEGTGDRRVSDAAGDAVSKMTSSELADLLKATKTAAPSR